MVIVLQFYVWRRSHGKSGVQSCVCLKGNSRHTLISCSLKMPDCIVIWYMWAEGDMFYLTYKVNLLSLGLKIMWPCLIFAGKSYVKCRLCWQHIWSLSVCGQLLSKDMISLANGKLNERKKIDEDIGMRYQSFIGYTNSWSHKRW